MNGGERLAIRLSHEFATPALLDEALRHRSALSVRKQGHNSNERLEFVGDRVLGLLMAEWLIERFPREREGDLGKRLAALVSRDAVAAVLRRREGMAAAAALCEACNMRHRYGPLELLGAGLGLARARLREG